MGSIVIRNGKLTSPINGISSSNGKVKDTLVLGHSSQGVEIRSTLLRLTRFLAALEIYSPNLVLRTSEVISDFKILLHDRSIYSGRAVVRSLVNTGAMTICEVTLDENSWTDVNFASEMIDNGKLRAEFQAFKLEWQKHCKILPEFKVAISDLQNFLMNLRLWLDQVELGIRSSPSEDRAKLEQDAVGELKETVVPVIKELFDRFESVSGRVDEELRPAHVAFGKRQMHPFLLCSPFVYRTFAKPLGYAGDYEVVNMMFRNPCEGGSLFAKMVNSYALQLPPIIAHRNRISYLCDRLTAETSRVALRGRRVRVFNLGCGPAQEVQRFLAGGTFCDQCEFVLCDFNDETLAYTEGILRKLKEKSGLQTPVQLVKKTAQQLIKQSERYIERSPDAQFDLVYCAGLFDYLSDKVCRRLMDALYQMLSPRGLLLATNVDVNPSQNEMEYFLEWHLITRNHEQMMSLSPQRADREHVRLVRDSSGVNIFLEVRKPAGER